MEHKPSPAQVDYGALTRRLDDAQRQLDREPTPEERRAILAARAKLLAPSRDVAQAESIEVLAFRVGGERYAVPIGQVDQVGEPKQLWSLPGVPRYVLGTTVARSRIIVVLDLRHLLGLEGGGMSDLTQVVVVIVGDIRFGMAAELVEGRIAMPKTGATRATEGPFSLIGSDGLALIDVEALARVASADKAA